MKKIIYVQIKKHKTTFSIGFLSFTMWGASFYDFISGPGQENASRSMFFRYQIPTHKYSMFRADFQPPLLIVPIAGLEECWRCVSKPFLPPPLKKTKRSVQKDSVYTLCAHGKSFCWYRKTIYDKITWTYPAGVKFYPCVICAPNNIGQRK